MQNLKQSVTWYYWVKKRYINGCTEEIDRGDVQRRCTEDMRRRDAMTRICWHQILGILLFFCPSPWISFFPIFPSFLDLPDLIHSSYFSNQEEEKKNLKKSYMVSALYRIRPWVRHASLFSSSLIELMGNFIAYEVMYDEAFCGDFHSFNVFTIG